MTSMVFKRVVTSDDAERLRVIRNYCKDYMTRNTSYITPKQQQEWFSTAYLKYDLFIAYAVEYGAIIVDAGYGVINKTENEYLLTGGLMPDYRDKGYGQGLFKFLIDTCDKKWPIRLEVLKTNIRAFKTYEKLGFVIIGEDERIYRMEYRYDSVI